MGLKKWILRVLFSLFVVVGSIQPITAQEAFIIDEADIQMVVHEDGTVEIEESFNLNFSQARHGFYRNIPTEYHMNWTVDGKNVTETYYFPVKDITCSTECSIEGDSTSVIIKLGDANRTVIGPQRYRIRYTVKTKDLNLDTKEQMLYWNLLNGFDTQTRLLTYSITMPKAFDQQQVFTYAGAFGEALDSVTHRVDGNIIRGESTKVIGNNESATIKVNLPNDYFTYPAQKDYSLLAIGLSLGLLLISALLFMKFGKDDEVIVTVEFGAPEGLDSASVGYVIDNQVESKDIISLIIDWANRGFLKIHDDKEGFKLEKLQDMTKENSKAYERVFFAAIFTKGDIVSEEDLKNETVAKGLNNAKLMLKNSFAKDPKKRIYSSASIFLQFFMTLFITLPGLLFTFATVMAKYELLPLVIPYMIPAIILGISCVPWIFIMQKRHVMKRNTLLLTTIALLLVNTVLICFNGLMQVMNGAGILPVVICGISTFLLIILMIFMDKRTEQGTLWLGQILGLKEFIISCEQERLELLVKDDPSAFYAILPYAYVLGISDVWVKKFESIAMNNPSWYVGPQGNVFTTVLWWNHFHYCFNHIYTATTYTPPHTSGTGGGSFGGGGFSGGGFSGGGFGGGGGGSW